MGAAATELRAILDKVSDRTLACCLHICQLDVSRPPLAAAQPLTVLEDDILAVLEEPGCGLLTLLQIGNHLQRHHRGGGVSSIKAAVRRLKQLGRIHTPRGPRSGYATIAPADSRF